MANRPGKHSAPLNSGTSRRGAHSAPLGSTQGRRGSHSAPVTSAGRSTRSAQAARSRSAQADASRTPRASRARSSFEGTGFAPTASPVSAVSDSRSFAATDSLARAKAARKKSRGKKIALGIAAALVVVLAGAGGALALYLNGINATIQGGLDDAEDVYKRQSSGGIVFAGRFLVAAMGFFDSLRSLRMTRD